MKVTNILQPKTCPNCREPNKPDAQFCFKCNFVMSFEAYQKGMEEGQRKDQEVNELKEQMAKMNEFVEKLHGYVELYKPAFETVMKQANPHLGGKFIDIDMSIVKENWPSREKKL